MINYKVVLVQSILYTYTIQTPAKATFFKFNIMDETKLLQLVRSGQIENIVLVGSTLIQLGEGLLLDFIERNGEVPPNRIRDGIVSNKAIITGYNHKRLRDIVQIIYDSPSTGNRHRIYCGPWLSVSDDFKHITDHATKIVDFTNIKINK